MTERPRCAWCSGEIPPGKRRDAETCSKPCRQARHRFKSLVGHPTAVEAGHPRRLAYADPPYPGMSARYYSEHPDYAGEVDHADLAEELLGHYDAFALSTSAEALPRILRLFPDDVRVAAWVRGGRPNHTASRPRSSWEPVIYGGKIRVPVARRSPDASRSPADATARPLDSLIYHAKARTTDPGRVIGAKPAPFARWLFELLAAQPHDELVDLFPGSGGITRAWEAYRSTDASRVAAATRDASGQPGGTPVQIHYDPPVPRVVYVPVPGLGGGMRA